MNKIVRLLGLMLGLAWLMGMGGVQPAQMPDGPAVRGAVTAGGRAIRAASCSQADVQAAVDAAGEGDFVLVPAGACTWTTPEAYTPAVSIADKAITIRGAGVDKTLIADATGTLWKQTPFWIDAVEGKPVRITGFTFNGTADTQGVIAVRGASEAFRVDHIKFDGTVHGVTVIGRTYGVIDHCDFLYPEGIRGVWIADQRGDPPGSTSWEEPMSFGTADAVFVEDCSFIWGQGSDGAIDCTTGARYVFRHNVVEGIMAGNHGMDSASRSCLQMEIYDNVFLPPSHSTFLAIQSRGGSAVAFNNVISGTYGAGIGVTNYRSCCYAGASCSSHGTCDGTNPLDGNTPPQEVYKGWPCKDQIGRGTQQTLHPFYEWNNTMNGADVDVTVYNGWPTCTDPQPSDHVQENRDYYNDTPKPDYRPYLYPHPLTEELWLTGAPAAGTAYLNWSVASWTYVPPTTTWRIEYEGTPGSQTSPITGIVSPTRAYTLTGLVNYEWYTVTLSAMLDSTPFLSDTVRVMPTGWLVYLPLVVRDSGVWPAGTRDVNGLP